jgi:His/Glu/Gln/Arg/opine family amino acid ABC transporter permease subunit
MNFDIAVTWEALPRLLDGALLTLALSAVSLVISIVLATLLTVLRETGWKPAIVAIGVYVSYIRGTPLLVQIFLVFYVLPRIGIDLGPVTAGIAALSLSSAAFTLEIMRGGLAAIPKGQLEAARALGLSGLTIWTRVVLPQMFNYIVPPLVNEFTLVIKGTPLVSVITVVELMRTAQQIYNANYRPVEVLFGVAVIFFILNFSLSRAAANYERRNVAKFA